MKSRLWLTSFIAVFFGIMSPFSSTVVYAATNSIVAVDTAGNTGQYTSLVLDSKGNPIISYYDVSEAKLKVVHCFDKNCATFDAILTPDAANSVGQYTSNALDNNGNPVVSYYDQTNSALKLLHCGNASCSTGNSIASPDTGGVGQYTSVTVNGNGLPIVSYYDVTHGKLKVLVCGNAGCTSGNTIVTPDVSSSNGVQSSVKLNAAGNPVVAYFDFTNSSLKLLTCGNAKCNAGNIITTIDSAGDVGRYPSLVLDKNGNPAISYLDLTNGKLKVVRCGNATCSAGNVMTPINVSGVAGYFSSLMLDKNGNPIVSFYNRSNTDLNILQCGNATCTSGNTITTPDTAGNVGQYTSLKLDANGNPVVSYYDASNGDLKVLHCGSSSCNPNSIVVADASSSNIGQYTSLKLDAMGKPVVSYWDEANGDLKLLHCGDADCTANNSITSPDTTGNTGWDTSLALDVSGNPVISMFDFTNTIMKILHCNNVNCTGAGTITKPDTLSRRHTSIALDSTGNPVVASSGQSDQGIRIVHCGDATCTSNNAVASPDMPAFPFNADIRGVSLILDSSGNPVVSYYRADQSQLKILHCADVACNGPGNSIAVVDPGAQAADHRSTSLTLDASGNPVMAYQDTANNALKVLHCGNANCTAGNTIASPVTGPGVGAQPSIKLDVAGNPVVSYSTTNGLSVLHCGNATCTMGNTITLADSTVSGAWDGSLALDASGNPVVSYYNATGKNLKILHCGTPTC